MSARRQIIAALSEDSLGGIATLQDVEPAEQLVDAYRIEVLAEVTTWLTKKAREERAAGTREDRTRADVMASLASKIARGAVRPNNLRMLPDPGFFEVDHTYTRGYWTFQCLAVEPITWGSREARAIGFLTRLDGTGTVTSLDPDNWAHGGWTDTTNDTTRKDRAS